MSLSTDSAESAQSNNQVVAIKLLSAAVDTGDARHQEAISQLERCLVSPLYFEGQADPAFTLEERMAYYRVPGVSMALIENGAIVWVKSWGVQDVDSQQPMTTDTLLQAASISKPLSAFAALRMVESGHLSLDQPINNYLTQWQLPENHFTQQVPVNLSHLLSHTGGVTVHGFRGYAQTEPQPSAIQVLNGDAIAASDPVVVGTLPGEQFRYSGGGSTVFQIAMEDVSQQSFTQLMQDLVLTPSGMTASTYEQPLPEKLKSDVASGHLVDGSVVPGLWHNYPTQSAASLWTTPTDLAKFSLVVIEASQAGSETLLSKPLCEQFLTEQKSAWGLGPRLFLEDGKTIGFHHGGANTGYRCNTLAFLDGSGSVIMTNSDAGDALGAEMQAAAAELYDWPAHKRQSKSWLPISEQQRALLTGVYALDYDDETIEVSVQLGPDGLEILSPWYAPASQYLLTEQYENSLCFTNNLGATAMFGKNHNEQSIVTLRNIIFTLRG